MKLALSRRAASDIAEIADFTIARWGIDQADRYVSGLRDLLCLMADRSEAGASSARLPEAIRRQKYRSHMIFFEWRGDRLWVIRVLHQRMDHVRHLSGG